MFVINIRVGFFDLFCFTFDMLNFSEFLAKIKYVRFNVDVVARFAI